MIGIEVDMIAEAVPEVFTPTQASRLTGFSRQSVYSMVKHGIVARAWLGIGFDHPGVTKADIEAIRGRPITAAEWKATLAAEDRHKNRVQSRTGN
jgi:hypothetical protein